MDKFDASIITKDFASIALFKTSFSSSKTENPNIGTINAPHLKALSLNHILYTHNYEYFCTQNVVKVFSSKFIQSFITAHIQNLQKAALARFLVLSSQNLRRNYIVHMQLTSNILKN